MTVTSLSHLWTSSHAWRAPCTKVFMREACKLVSLWCSKGRSGSYLAGDGLLKTHFFLWGQIDVTDEPGKTQSETFTYVLNPLTNVTTSRKPVVSLPPVKRVIYKSSYANELVTTIKCRKQLPPQSEDHYKRPKDPTDWTTRPLPPTRTSGSDTAHANAYASRAAI